MDRGMPGYMIREELQRGKLRERAGRRAWGFEKRLGDGKGSEWTRKCWQKLKERAKNGRGESGWEKERRGFF